MLVFRRRRARVSARVALVSILGLVLCTLLLLELNLRPTLLAAGEIRARFAASQAIATALGEELMANVRYEELISTDKDKEGRIVMMQPNTVLTAMLCRRATDAVLRELKHLDRQRVGIPLGQAFGSRLLANLGPRIWVTMTPIGAAEVSIRDRFESAGINQTRHSIYLETTATVRILVPLFSSDVTVTTTTPVAEVVLMGQVPHTYLRFGP